MKRKILLVILVILPLIIVTYFAICRILDNTGTTNLPYEEPPVNSNVIEYNTTDNSQIIKTKSNSTIRVINYYDKSMFEGKNTILFMWASWCPNCADEFKELEKILKKYSKDEDVNIVLIAHEFKQDDGNLNSLLEMLENGSVDYDTEILLDFGRVIRKALDPEEKYIPRTYFLDKNTNILEELEDAVTFEQVETLINKYYK